MKKTLNGKKDRTGQAGQARQVGGQGRVGLVGETGSLGGEHGGRENKGDRHGHMLEGKRGQQQLSLFLSLMLCFAACSIQREHFVP